MDIYPKEIALDYLAEGFSPIPVKFRLKEPRIKGWPQLRISANNVGNYFNDDPTNIGVLTGTPSGGLVDVDIDSPDALKFAPHFLPQTNCIFGRPSKLRSHWLYRVDDVGGYESFVGDTMVIELRGQKHYTLFPGSIHPRRTHRIRVSQRSHAFYFDVHQTQESSNKNRHCERTQQAMDTGHSTRTRIIGCGVARPPELDHR